MENENIYNPEEGSYDFDFLDEEMSNFLGDSEQSITSENLSDFLDEDTGFTFLSLIVLIFAAVKTFSKINNKLEEQATECVEASIKKFSKQERSKPKEKRYARSLLSKKIKYPTRFLVTQNRLSKLINRAYDEYLDDNEDMPPDGDCNSKGCPYNNRVVLCPLMFPCANQNNNIYQEE